MWFFVEFVQIANKNQLFQVTEYIQSLKSRRKFETSPAKALELASEHFENFGSKDACLLVIVADDGNSTDVAKESILAR